MSRIDQIRACNSCDWIGWGDDCVTPKHAESLLLCPECQETTFCITPAHVRELRDQINMSEDNRRTNMARIYIVEDTATEERFLVKANNQAQALKHVSQARYEVEAANAMDVAELMQEGVVVEDATAKEEADNDH